MCSALSYARSACSLSDSRDCTSSFSGRTLAECMRDRRASSRGASACRGARALQRGSRSRAARASAARRRNSRRARGAHDSVLHRVERRLRQDATSRSARRGLMPFFEGRLFSATEVPRGKPAPDVFLFAAERMGAAPARTAVIEDSVNGVLAGCAAGHDGVRLRGLTPAEKLAKRAPRARSHRCARCRRCSPADPSPTE